VCGPRAKHVCLERVCSTVVGGFFWGWDFGGEGNGESEPACGGLGRMGRLGIQILVRLLPCLEVGRGGEVECFSQQGFELGEGVVAKAAR